MHNAYPTSCLQLMTNNIVFFPFHFFDSVFPHGRTSIYALLLGISAYLFLSVSMWSCVFMKINGYLYSESPFVWTGSTSVRDFVHGVWTHC
jgi:hypothetical protein